MSEEQKMVRFGRYLILDHLVDGGMARICRARFLGDQVDKIVAIKMIRAQYSQNPSFRKMFMDEIKVTFGLIHPNIAQTYDYGLLNDQLYTAMEYVDGKNLKQYLEALRKKKTVFPIEQSIYIISQVCQALSYAHNFTDKLTGKTLNIIHRDISPHNIMITYDGSVKVIDFGIAKSNTNTEETQAGTIKGKISYLAPEYLEGATLDHTYDQFAVGITLWEMLCGRKLFSAENELAVLKKIQECVIPAPSSINKRVPKELDEIILKSVSKQRHLRYENMDSFNRALVKFLHSTYSDFSSADLSLYAKELFKEDIKKDREKLVELGKIDITSYIEDMKKEQDGRNIGSSGNKEVEDTISKSEINKPQVFDLEMNDEESKELSKKLTLEFRGTENIVSMGHRSSRVAVKKATAGEEAIASSTVSKKEGQDGSTNGYYGHRKSSYGFAVAFVLILLFSGGGYFYLDKKGILENKQTQMITEKNGLRDMATITEEAENKNVKVDILLRNIRPTQEFYLDNEKIDVSSGRMSIARDRDYLLRVEAGDNSAYFRPLFIHLQAENKVVTIPDTTSSIPFGILEALDIDEYEKKKLSYELDGYKIIVPLPLSKGLRLPVGEYKGQIEDASIAPPIVKEIVFEIKEDSITKLPSR